MIENLKCYKLSRDYTRLKELLDKGFQVVCTVRSDFNRYCRGESDYKPMMVRDICVARYFDSDNDEYKHYGFSVRGQGYGDYYPKWDKRSFEEFCEKPLDLEFIEPALSPQILANLDEAAKKWLESYCTNEKLTPAGFLGFKAGAKWMAEQGSNYTTIVKEDGSLPIDARKGYPSGFKAGDKVIAQIRKAE